MPKTAMVTDSTAWIPKDLVDQYNITVAPQVLIWGEETLYDGVDIQPQDFYARIKTAKVMPTTSQVSVMTMQSIFNGFLEKGFDVLGIFLSSKLSGTIQSATQAREALNQGQDRVHIHDSLSTAMAMGRKRLKCPWMTRKRWRASKALPLKSGETSTTLKCDSEPGGTL